MRRLATLSALGSVALALSWSSVAAAYPYIRQAGRTKPQELSITPMVGISGLYGLEAGVKVDYLLVNPGFIPHLNNSVFLEGGVFVAADGGPFVAPELRWEFHLHPQWSVYGEAGLEANLGAEKDDPSVSIVTAIGAVWRLPGKSFNVRGEVDRAHGAARLGASF